MNLSALGTHFKSAKKEMRVIIAPTDDAFLATEQRIIARLTHDQLPRVFSRRDIWPEIPVLRGGTWVYWTSDDEELDPAERNMAECQPEAGETVVGKWREWTDHLQLNPLTFTPWIQLFEKGVMAHLLRIPGGDYFYVDYDLVALFSSIPAKLRWYGTDPTSPVVVATEENELLGLIAPLERSKLETLTPPTDVAAPESDGRVKEVISQTLDPGTGQIKGEDASPPDFCIPCTETKKGAECRFAIAGKCETWQAHIQGLEAFGDPDQPKRP